MHNSTICLHVADLVPHQASITILDPVSGAMNDGGISCLHAGSQLLLLCDNVLDVLLTHNWYSDLSIRLLSWAQWTRG